MKYTTYHDLTLSRLFLGTVQLGINYGISNTTGKPDRAHAFAILDEAMAQKINVLDTAAAYGDSELVIGDWLSNRPRETWPYIVTKAVNLDAASPETIYRSLKESARSSMAHLGLSKLPLLMLHHCDEYLADPPAVRAAFQKLKEEGLIQRWGISAYAHHDYRMIADSGCDAVQIPVNLFDWRQIENGGIDALKKAGCMIFVRSVYLQGLVFRDPETLDERMAFCRETLRNFRSLCDQFSMTPAELSLSFALTLPGVTSLVLGSETPEQVRMNADLFSGVRTLTKDEMEHICQVFRETDPRILTPSLW